MFDVRLKETRQNWTPLEKQPLFKNFTLKNFIWPKFIFHALVLVISQINKTQNSD